MPIQQMAKETLPVIEPGRTAVKTNESLSPQIATELGLQVHLATGDQRNCLLQSTATLLSPEDRIKYAKQHVALIREEGQTYCTVIANAVLATELAPAVRKRGIETPLPYIYID